MNSNPGGFLDIANSIMISQNHSLKLRRLADERGKVINLRAELSRTMKDGMNLNHSQTNSCSNMLDFFIYFLQTLKTIPKILYFW
jgi:hypothetical protein